MNRELDVLICGNIASFLPARDIVKTAAVNKAFSLGCEQNEIWLLRLQEDFNYFDKQKNRSPGFYKRYYLALIEDRLEADNLISGGH